MGNRSAVSGAMSLVKGLDVEALLVLSAELRICTRLWGGHASTVEGGHGSERICAQKFCLPVLKFTVNLVYGYSAIGCDEVFQKIVCVYGFGLNGLIKMVMYFCLKIQRFMKFGFVKCFVINGDG
ncbi:hypothetical protein RYX36_025821 [Vicia faba]